MDIQNPGKADGVSLCMTFGFITLKIFNSITKEEASFWMAMLVGASTLAYNLVKMILEVKKKK